MKLQFCAAFTLSRICSGRDAPMSTEHIMGYDSNRSPYKIGAFVSSALFDNMMAEWYNDAEWNTKYVNGFDALDLNELLKAAS